MNKRIVLSLYKKEMMDVLRDKKTVLMMLIVPLVIYPLMFVFGLQLMSSITKDMEQSTYRVALFGYYDDALIDSLNTRIEKDDFKIEIQAAESVKDAFVNKEIDVCIEGILTEDKPEFKIYYMSSVNNSSYGADIVKSLLLRYSLGITSGILEDNGLVPDSVLNPIKIEYSDMSSNEEAAGNILGLILPFMLVVSILMGTMYPAIDTTAGERERDTLETVLTLPISNHTLIVSKFLAVSTIGVVSAMLNVISMGFVGVYMFNMMKQVSGTARLNMTSFLPAIIIGVLCVCAFAIFMSAITMCVCAFAKTYKEANNYITPLTLVVMFASFIGFIPGVNLDSRMALAPVANICLLIKDILSFKFNIGIIAIVLISNIAYGIIAVIILGKLYNSEAILFGDGSSSVKIFEKRSNMLKGGVPTIGDAWLILAVTAVIIIYIGGSVQLKYGLAGVLITQLIIAGIPIAVSFYTKKSFNATFKLRSCKPSCIPAAVILILGTMLLGIVLTAIVGMIFKESSVNADSSMESLFAGRFIVSLLVMAVVPAICEEIMFRGYILSAMETKMKQSSAILVSAALFGVYHMSIVKFFTTTLLGIVICYVASTTKSLIPGMIMHFINNALACVQMYYPDKLAKVIPVFAKEEVEVKDMLLLVVTGIVMCLIGVVFVMKTSVTETKENKRMEEI